MRVSHFASIRAIVPSDAFDGNTNKLALFKTVGMAQNISIDDNFGSRGENTIGTPLPVLAPGYMMTNIRIEKATIDGTDFRNLGGFNPLWAHIGETYKDENLIDLNNVPQRADLGIEDTAGADGAKMYPFMFILAIKNKVSNSHSKSNILKDAPRNPFDTGSAIVPTNQLGNAKANTFGVYVCVAQSAQVAISSQQAVILDNLTAIARQVSGAWLSEQIKGAFSRQDSGEVGSNGMRDVLYSVLFGYRS